eukprot:TRINITY_DN40024_c0_g1_i1.p1 TRINITY_DN40024_c0_g1~~TRINITY_DN40024_c0_g1_i1.p1  ORF type:complete len:211 (+),score=11.18 TRINITY_DN40024_c0_g1_i1:98-730(+)
MHTTYGVAPYIIFTILLHATLACEIIRSELVIWSPLKEKQCWAVSCANGVVAVLVKEQGLTVSGGVRTGDVVKGESVVFEAGPGLVHADVRIGCDDGVKFAKIGGLKPDMFDTHPDTYTPWSGRHDGRTPNDQSTTPVPPPLPVPATTPPVLSTALTTALFIAILAASACCCLYSLFPYIRLRTPPSPPLPTTGLPALAHQWEPKLHEPI